MNQNQTDLEHKLVETQETINNIVADLEELTKQLSSFKPTNESALGDGKGKISTKVSNRLSTTEQKVSHLSEELEKQNKFATKNAEMLRDLLLGIENLRDNMKNINA